MSLTVKQNVPLADYTTFCVGGPAKFFCIAQSEDDLKEAITWANENSQPILVLAGGSNIIASTKGFEGLVVKVEINFVRWHGNVMEAGCGTSVEQLVNESIEHGLGGLEWAGGLPGSFGGAIRGNAGAFGGEIKDSIESVRTISTENGEITDWDNRACQFAYRDSVFKQKGTEIIISAALRLTTGDQTELRRIADSRIAYRQEKHPMEYPNSGSIFKNTPVEKIAPDVLEQWQDVVKSDPFPVVPTAKIIADTQLAGRQVGDAQLSTKHTNYIVNLGNATGEDIFELIKEIKSEVFQRFGVELEVEPELVGF